MLTEAKAAQAVPTLHHQDMTDHELHKTTMGNRAAAAGDGGIGGGEVVVVNKRGTPAGRFTAFRRPRARPVFDRVGETPRHTRYEDEPS
jgi:hypothetical protein